MRLTETHSRCPHARGLALLPPRNPELPQLKQHCALDEAPLSFLQIAMADLGFSARAYDRILKVSRTIADLAATERIAAEHVSEAVQLRSLDRQLWGQRK